MTRVLVNIRGTNGAGKTSLVKSLITENTEKISLNDKIIATRFPEYNLIAVGDYSNEKIIGGLDELKTQTQYFQILNYLCKNYSENILMEGIIASTVYSTYYKEFIKIWSKYNIKPIILFLFPKLPTCLNRIKQRNHSKKFKSELVRDKYKMIINNYKKFKKTGIPCYTYDNTEKTTDESKKYLLKVIKYNEKK